MKNTFQNMGKKAKLNNNQRIESPMRKNNSNFLVKGVTSIIVIIILFAIAYTGLSKGVSGEEVMVFNKKPLIFGRGGVSNTPLMSGRSFVSPTTETITFKHTPIAYTEKFDDMVSSDNVPVNTTVTAILQIDGSKAPALY